MDTTSQVKLNKRQQEAAEHGDGPLLIIAGAGTGKTTVVVERVKFLLAQKKINTRDLLALTFTEKAAREMVERVDRALPLGSGNVEIGTFHSWGERFLRDEIIHLGLSPAFRLLTEAEMILFLEKHWWTLPLTYFRPITNPKKYLGALINHFSRLRDEGITPSDYDHFAKQVTETDEAEKWTKREWQELAEVYKKFQEIKEQQGVMDFADLVYYTWRVLKERPQVTRKYQERYKYILVDEYQDTNIAQNDIVKLLAGDRQNITVVCDDDQAIYRFRGAAVSNVIQFRQDFPQSKLVTLTENYRSTQAILDSAYTLITHNNPDRLEVAENIDKKLTGIKGQGEKPHFRLSSRVEDEGTEVVNTISEEQKKYKRQWRDFAILVRANNHADVFAHELERQKIPFQFLGPGKLFRRPEIKDLMAWLTLLNDPGNEVAFYRVATFPVWDISPRDLAFLRSSAKRLGKTQMEVVEEMVDSTKTENPEVGLGRLYHLWLEQVAELPKKTGGQIVYDFLEKTGILDQLINPNTEKLQQMALTLGKLFDKVKAFETDPDNRVWPRILDWMNLKMEMGESPLASDSDWTENNAVNILTVHSAKGLEFPVVFLVNLSAGRFPTYERHEQIPIPNALLKEILPTGDAHEQEERRLLYVGMTRAKEKLYLSASCFYQEEAKRERKVSQFVVEALGDQVFSAPKFTGEKQMDWLSEWGEKGEEEKEDKKEPVNHSITYLSYSQLDCFHTCPLQYKYRYILAIPSLPSVSLIVGQILHQTLKDYFLRVNAKILQITWQDILAIFDLYWKQGTFPGKEVAQKAYTETVSRLKNYFDHEIAPKEWPKVLALEEPFKIRTEGNLTIGGRIDRIDELTDGRVEVIDYKTGKEKSQKEVDGDKQVSIYALAISRLAGKPFYRPAEKIKLSFYFLENNVKVSTTRSEQELQEVEKEVVQTAKTIETSTFPAKPARPFPCDFCEYKLICEAWQ